MDEIETRLATLEGLMLERLALEPPGVIAQLVDQVQTWPDDVQRAQALALIDDATRRFDAFTPGTRSR